MKTYLINYIVKGEKGVKQAEAQGNTQQVAETNFIYSQRKIVRITKAVLLKEKFND